MSAQSSTSRQHTAPVLASLSNSIAPAGRPGPTLALMVGFYLLALGVAAALLSVIFLEWEVLGVVHYQIILACVVGAGAILISIIPRPDRFKAPGPLLAPVDQPELFALLAELGRETGQPLPAKVYLIPEVNAWVAQRGGVLGLGSRRIMGIGLPLLQILTHSQLRAVLTHEYGHYYGGDTRLAPYIYQTYKAMIRSVSALSRQDQGLSILFVAYARMFLRQTQAISRRQEFVADQLAAHVAGSSAIISSLRAIRGTAPVYDTYWKTEVVPVLKGNKLPPLAEGFRRFVGHRSVAAIITRNIEEDLRTAVADPFDTHPLLSERIAALQTLPADSPPIIDPPAADLLRHVPDLERQLLSVLFDSKMVSQLQPITWDVAGTSAYIPQWERELRRQSRAVKGITPRRMPELAQRLVAFGGELLPPSGRISELGLGEMRHLAGSILGMGLTVALFRQGWEVEVLPGEDPRVHRGDETIETFAVAELLARGKISAEYWVRKCEKWNIADLDFGTL